MRTIAAHSVLVYTYLEIANG